MKVLCTLLVECLGGISEVIEVKSDPSGAGLLVEYSPRRGIVRLGCVVW